MTFDFNSMLRDKLVALQKDLGLSNFNIEVDAEQAFLKSKDMQPNTIYVLTKLLQNDRSIGVETQPIQIFILSEQDSLDVCKALLSEFAKRNNFVAFTSGTDWIKQQYTDPVVLSNFNTVDFGYRSVLYVSATLYIMEDVIDVSNVTIDSIPVKALTFGFTYSMTTNTQQMATESIASSQKTVSSFGVTMSIPLVKNVVVEKILKIVDEYENYTGNEPFAVSFDCKTSDKEFGITISKTLKLINAQLTTAINQVPALQLGFIK